jgi:hypothetical protein
VAGAVAAAFGARGVLGVFVDGYYLWPDTALYASGGAAWSSPLAALVGTLGGWRGVQLLGLVGAISFGALVGWLVPLRRRGVRLVSSFVLPPSWYTYCASPDALGATAALVSYRVRGWRREALAVGGTCAVHLVAGLVLLACLVARRTRISGGLAGLGAGVLACVGEQHVQVRYLLPGLAIAVCEARPFSRLPRVRLSRRRLASVVAAGTLGALVAVPGALASGGTPSVSTTGSWTSDIGFTVSGTITAAPGAVCRVYGGQLVDGQLYEDGSLVPCAGGDSTEPCGGWCGFNGDQVTDPVYWVEAVSGGVRERWCVGGDVSQCQAIADWHLDDDGPSFESFFGPELSHLGGDELSATLLGGTLSSSLFDFAGLVPPLGGEVDAAFRTGLFLGASLLAMFTGWRALRWFVLR